MNVRPTSTPNTTPSDAAALRRAMPETGERTEGAPVAPDDRRRDAVELSREALDLQASRADNASPQLPPERMKTILTRLSEGYYDRLDVRDRILELIAAVLENEP